MRFDEFMRRALYDPDHGYYRRGMHRSSDRDLSPPDPFGIKGDFYTASQIQPLFGQVIASEARALAPGMPFLELGPGRREVAEHVGPLYRGVEIGEHLPPSITGFVFANEFFDALPVRAGVRETSKFYELVVEAGKFKRGVELEEHAQQYVARYWPFVPEGGRFEIAEESLQWIDRLAERMDAGFLLIVDYGYTTAETIRFPEGTLMSYRQHLASPDILREPGSRDITAHVAFDAIRDHSLCHGFRVVRFGTLAQLTLDAVKRNPELIDGVSAQQQLKTLLFGMGEVFRCLLLQTSRV